MVKGMLFFYQYQSNQRTRIHRRFKVKLPNNIQQQSSQNTDATKFNAIME